LIRTLVIPLMAVAVRLEDAGLTWGPEQALFAIAVRQCPASEELVHFSKPGAEGPWRG
jgi:hypothetical protein